MGKTIINQEKKKKLVFKYLGGLSQLFFLCFFLSLLAKVQTRNWLFFFSFFSLFFFFPYIKLAFFLIEYEILLNFLRIISFEVPQKNFFPSFFSTFIHIKSLQNCRWRASGDLALFILHSSGFLHNIYYLGLGQLLNQKYFAQWWCFLHSA